MKVECDELEKKNADSFVLSIKPEGISGEIRSSTQSQFTDFIGSYLATNSSTIVNTASLFISILIISFLMIRLKKRRDTGTHTRESLINLMNGVKLEIVKERETKRRKNTKRRRKRTSKKR